MKSMHQSLLKQVICQWQALGFFALGHLEGPIWHIMLSLKQLRIKEVINLNNNGNMYRDMTFIDDIVGGITEQLITFLA